MRSQEVSAQSQLNWMSLRNFVCTGLSGDEGLVLSVPYFCSEQKLNDLTGLSGDGRNYALEHLTEESFFR